MMRTRRIDEAPAAWRASCYASKIVYPARYNIKNLRKSSSCPIRAHAFLLRSRRMYSRGRIYGALSKLACLPIIPRHCLISRPLNPLQSQWGPLESNHSDYQRTNFRLSHAAAAEKEGNNQADKQSLPAGRRLSNASLRFITFDQTQHDLGSESKEISERERYSDQIAGFLPTDLVTRPKKERSHRHPYGKNKEDKLFINKLLKAKGSRSENWRIALSDLLKHSILEKDENVKDIDTPIHAPSLVPTDSSQTQDHRGRNEDPSLIRRVASKSRNYRYFRLARNISPPTKWSEANLAVYVEALAESQRTQDRIPWTLKSWPKEWSNLEDIITVFDKIFYNPALQNALSIEACNTALRFFYDYGMMTKARALYIRMEDIKMAISTVTFNILLRGSASRKDLHNFAFLLNKMTRRGFRPDEVTWTLFLQVLESDKVRAVIVRKMAEMSMLEKIGIRRDVAVHMVHYELAQHLDNGHDHHSFLNHMNSKYGIGWISTSSGNRLLNEVAKRKSTAESLSLLYEMKQAGFMPDDISMNSLLRHCLPLRQHDLAIEILDAFKHLYRLYPGPGAYETLFLQAWRSRRLNFATVIWRSACIYGAVSAKTQSLVFRSLLFYTPALDTLGQSNNVADYGTPNKSARFKKFAGKFVIGLDGPEGAALSQAVDALEPEPKKRIVRWAQTLLRISLQVSRTGVLKSDFSQLLRQALGMDKTWATEGLYKKDDWRELFPHAIAVDMKFRKRRPHRRPRRLRGSSVRSHQHARLLTPSKGSAPDPNHQKSPNLNPRSRIRMRNPRNKSLRKAKPTWKARRRIPLARPRSRLCSTP